MTHKDIWVRVLSDSVEYCGCGETRAAEGHRHAWFHFGRDPYPLKRCECGARGIDGRPVSAEVVAELEGRAS